MNDSEFYMGGSMNGSDRPYEDTGHVLVTLKEGFSGNIESLLNEKLGMRGLARSADYESGSVEFSEVGDSDAVCFSETGILSFKMDPMEISALGVGESDSPFLAVEPDIVMHALPGVSQEYLRGYSRGLSSAALGLLDESREDGFGSLSMSEIFRDDAELTWGLRAVGLTTKDDLRFTGRGIRVAVLDTGLLETHPDFQGRLIISKSFVPNEAVEDRNGHGTHCCGTACGRDMRDSSTRRYGVASEAALYVGKVLSNAGSGSSRGVINGIEWAIREKCEVISMSLGSRVQPMQRYLVAYERAGQTALKHGSLIVAAAGNESHRPNFISPVGSPANCPSILAVGAVGQGLEIASFSCGGVNPDGGEVNIAAPGDSVFSSYLMPGRYRWLRGTSMATPHVAGIAALWAQQSGLRGRDLWRLLEQRAKKLPLPSRDVGSGLAQVPS